MLPRPLTIALAVSTLLAISTLFVPPAQAETTTVCTVAAEADTGKFLIREGDCDTSVSPASTFKIAISLMGFDSGFLKDGHSPELPFREGYADWIANWREATDPARWMKYSVVWYSQEITQALGQGRFTAYVESFAYGNEDVSGDPGQNNGLTNAWLSSSLTISPLEQLAFLTKVVRRELPIRPEAYEFTGQLVDVGVQPGGWHVYGKTGMGFPRNPDGAPIRGQPFGWFVGWATKGERTVVFARLLQDSERQSEPTSFRARDSVLDDLFSTPDAL